MAEHSETESGPEPGFLHEPLDELRSLAEGILADQKLADNEILFLRDWLERRADLAAAFPGNVIYRRITDVLEDGIITGEERRYLIDTLNTLISGNLDDLGESTRLTELWFDDAENLAYDHTRFCLTGNFVYGPFDVCRTAIEARGGIVSPRVGPEADFLVVGALGVDEWRHGGLGSMIETAMKLRAAGSPLKIIPEESWAAGL